MPFVYTNNWLKDLDNKTPRSLRLGAKHWLQR
jgi:hypothetical protein